jgi:hypothetical protein
MFLADDGTHYMTAPAISAIWRPLPPAKEMLALPNVDSRRHATVEQNRFSATGGPQIYERKNSKSRNDVRLRNVFGNVFVDAFVFVRHISGSSPCLAKMTPNGETA